MGGKFSGPNKNRKTPHLTDPTNRSVHGIDITSNWISSHTVHEYKRERQEEDFVIVDHRLSEYEDYLIKNEFQEEELRKWHGKEHEQKSMETPSGKNATSAESANISSENAFGKTVPPEAVRVYHQQKMLLEHYNRNVPENHQYKKHQQQTLLTEQHQKSFIEEQYHHQPLEEQNQQKLLSEKSQQKFLERHQQRHLGEQHQQTFLEQQIQQKILDHHQKLIEPQHNRTLLEEQQQQKHLVEQHQQKFTEKQQQQQRKPEYQQNLVEEQRQETLFEELLEEEYRQRLSKQKHSLKSLECKPIIIEHSQKEYMKEQGQQKILEKQKEEHLKIQHQQKFVERQQQKLVEERNQEEIPELFRQQQFELEKQQQQKYVEKQHQKSCLQEQYQQKDLGEQKHVKAQSYENLLEKECQEKKLKEWHQKKCTKKIMKLYKLAETQVNCLAPIRSRHLYHAVLRDRLATNWNSMPLNKMFMRVAIEEDTDEFRTVKNCFKATTQKQFEIVTIERVQNPFMLGCYILKKSEMESMYGAPNVKEKIVFRGTYISNIDKICENNFNWRPCADSRGNRYGRGVSLSPISYYASYYSDKNATKKAMFLVRVLTSKIIEGNKYMEIPPPVGKKVGNNNLSNVLRFDTTKRIDEKIIVKYNDNDFYPDYVIYYTVGPMPVKTVYQSDTSLDDYWFDEDFHSSSIC